MERAKQVLVGMGLSTVLLSVSVEELLPQQTLAWGCVTMECTGGPKLAGRANADYTQHKHTLRRAESQKLQRFLWLHSSPLNPGALAQVLQEYAQWTWLDV